jgi:hypothetical protein
MTISCVQDGIDVFNELLETRDTATIERYSTPISYNNFNFTYLKKNTPYNINDSFYVVQNQAETINGMPHHRVYNNNLERLCKWKDSKTEYKADLFDDAFKAYIRSKQIGAGPRPKKTKKQAVLPDGKIYDLFKSGKKWYVERECQSGTKKLVLVHPKK